MTSNSLAEFLAVEIAKPDPVLLFLAFVAGALSVEAINAERAEIRAAYIRSFEAQFLENLPRSKLLAKLLDIWRHRLRPAFYGETEIDLGFFNLPPDRERLVREWMAGEINLVGTTPATDRPNS